MDTPEIKSGVSMIILIIIESSSGMLSIVGERKNEKKE